MTQIPTDVGAATGDVIETLVTVMALNYIPYLGALTTTARALTHWTSEVDQVVGEGAAQAFVILGVAAVASATVAVAAWVTVSNKVDDLARRMERIGASAKFLDTWSAASVLAGRSADEFGNNIESLHNKIQDLALTPLTSIEQMFTGSHRSFSLLGLSPFMLNTMGTEEQLKTIADALANVHNKAIQATIARDLGLEQMLPYLQQGSRGIEELQHRLEKLNLTLTEEQSKAIQLGVAAWREFKLAMQGVAMQIAATVAPLMTLLANTLAYLAEWVSYLAKTWPTLTAILTSVGIVTLVVAGAVIAVAGAIVGVMMLLPGLTLMFEVLLDVLAALDAALFAITFANPIVGLIIAVSALIGYVLYATGVFSALWEAIKAVGKLLWDLAKVPLMIMWEMLKAVGKLIWDILAIPLMAVIAIMTVLGKIVYYLLIAPMLQFLTMIAKAAEWLDGFLFGGDSTMTMKADGSGSGGDSQTLKDLLSVNERQAATQQEMVNQLKKAAPPHMAYSW